MSTDLLIRGGRVLTMDPATRDLDEADVLVRGSEIAAVEPGIEADAEVIDATGCVVMPGFVDTHRHTWQTAMRGICADWTLLDYFRGVRLNLSALYRPEDMYAGNHLGALEALDAGVTTLLDFSHCTNTPEHADEAIRGLGDAGIRAVFAYGFYPVPLTEPGFADHEARLADARRVRSEHFSSDDALLTMGVAATELGLVPLDASRMEFGIAEELEALLTAHTGSVNDPLWPREVEILHGAGLLGPGQVHVHCNGCTDPELGLLADHGCAVSCTPETELQMGMGFPVIGRSIACGIKPSLGCDIASNNSGDMLTQLRMGLQTHRALANQDLLDRDEMAETLDLTVRDALEMATIDGARAMGLDSRIGTVAPGKQADLILVRSDSAARAPAADPAEAVALQSSRADVGTVLVGGTIVKRGGELLVADADRVRRLADESRSHILSGAEQRGGLLLDLPDGWYEVTRDAAHANVTEGPADAE